MTRLVAIANRNPTGSNPEPDVSQPEDRKPEPIKSGFLPVPPEPTCKLRTRKVNPVHISEIAVALDRQRDDRPEAGASCRLRDAQGEATSPCEEVDDSDRWCAPLVGWPSLATEEASVGIAASARGHCAIVG
jgi:hypothetical protein